MTPELTNAILQKIGYMGDEFRRYQAAVLLTALYVFPADVAADDVPPEFRPANRTTAGCVFALLKSDGLHLFSRSNRRASKEPKANARWLNTYQLTNRELAKTWLRQNGVQIDDAERAQLELAITA